MRGQDCLAAGNRNPPDPRSAQETTEVVTDKNGRYSIADVQPGSYGLKASLPRSEPIWPYASVEAPPDEITQVDFGGAGWVFVAGRAFDVSGKPIADGYLELRNASLSKTALTAPDGRFSLGWLRPGTYAWSILGNDDSRALGTGTVGIGVRNRGQS